MTAAAITLTDVTKRFGSHVALDSVSLEVPPGTAAVVLGPSGCGKTTMLRIIAGLEVPDSGQVLLNGTTVSAAGRAMYRRTGESSGSSFRTSRCGRISRFGRISTWYSAQWACHATNTTGERKTRSRLFALRSSRVGILTSSQAESSSASHSLARSFVSLACCCWTSPSRAWTQNSVQTCDPNSRGFSARSV